jgi:hypothetical protein
VRFLFAFLSAVSAVQAVKILTNDDSWLPLCVGLTILFGLLALIQDDAGGKS